MFIKQIARLVCVCLILSLVLVGPVLGEGSIGTGAGAEQVNGLIRGIDRTTLEAIQPAVSDLFHPYVTVLPDIDAYAIGVGDFNHDGLRDVAVSGMDYHSSTPHLYVLLQDPFNNFLPPVIYPSEGWPESLCVGDLNDDGWDDVVTTNLAAQKISVYLQQSDGTMGERTTYSSTIPELAVCGDFTGDGRDDIAVIEASSLRVFAQSDGGVLTPVSYTMTGSQNNDMDIGDLNDDGYTDIVKINGSFYANPNLSVYIQESGSLLNYVDYDLGDDNLASGGAVGDLNGDGRDDVVMGYHNAGYTANNLRVWLQNESHILVDSATLDAYSTTWPIETGDVNNDGRTDIILAHQDKAAVYLQQEDHSMAAYELYPYPSGYHYQQGLEVADVNSDGWLDVLIADRVQKGLFILYNKGSNHFLFSDPFEQDVNTGGSVQYNIKVMTPSGFIDSVDLDVSGLPAGAQAVWSNDPATAPDYSSTLTINIGTNVDGGSYPLTVTATSGVTQEQMEIGLTVNRWEWVFLPAVMRSKTVLYQDDFSNPASGWWIESNSIYAMNYVGGEYQIQVLQPGYIVWSTAGHDAADFEMTVSVRQANSTPAGYGIVFGMDYDNPPYHFYAFIVDPHPEYRSWALYEKIGSSMVKQLGWSNSNSINTGTAANQLKVKRVGYNTTFSINDTVVYSNYFLSTWSGSRRLGFTSLSWDVAPVDIRFDNYLVTAP